MVKTMIKINGIGTHFGIFGFILGKYNIVIENNDIRNVSQLKLLISSNVFSITW